MISLWGSFRIREVFPIIIYLGMLATSRHLLCWWCRGWCGVLKTRIRVCYHGLVFSNLVLSWMLLFVSRPGVVLLFLTIPISRYSPMMFFLFQYSIPEMYNFITYDCSFAFIHSPPTCSQNFISLFWKHVFNYNHHHHYYYYYYYYYKSLKRFSH